MNWFKKMINRTFAGGEKSFTAPSALELSSARELSRLPDPASRNYYPYARAYADKAWVYTCVSVISDAVSSAGILLKDGSGKTIDKHPALDLLCRPNQFMSGRTLKQWIISSLELTGNAYILKDARKGRKPTELFPLLSHMVEIVPGKTSGQPVSGYRYRAGAQTAFYGAQDVIHFNTSTRSISSTGFRL